MIQLFDMSLIQKAQNFLLKLSTAFARDDFDQTNFFPQRFLDDVFQGLIESAAVIVDVVEVNFEFSHSAP